MNDVSSFIPKEAVSMINQWLNRYKCKLIISKPRKTKLGDYRWPQNGKGHIISINNNLNKYAFLLTLTHEIAHMMVWEKYQNHVQPHGVEWKRIFQKLMLNFLPFYPNEILKPLAKHLVNPRSSTTYDLDLSLSLRKHNIDKTTLISDIPMGSSFFTKDKREFIKLEKLRKRYRCIDKHNNKVYLFSPLAEVTPI
jgi:hypothetical protein